MSSAEKNVAMAADDKPSRPNVYTHVPRHSQSSSAGPSSPAAAAAAAATVTASAFQLPWETAHKAGRVALAKKRWLAVFAFYLLLCAGWFRGWHRSEWLRNALPGAYGRIRLLPGEKLVFDAYGDPHFYPPRTGPARQEAVVEEALAATAGSTSLGPAADAVYHLSDPSPALYLHKLESFLVDHFPARDSDPSDPRSLLNAVRSFFPAPSEPTVNATIPHRIWMTAANQHDFRQKEEKIRYWLEKNPGWDMRKHDDAQADAWVRHRFGLTAAGDSISARDGAEKKGRASNRGIVAAWDRLAEPAVLRSDFWRYLVLAVDGGVYADTDVECLKPIERWGDDPDWNGARPEGYQEPALIVGVEADVGNRHDWHDWWPRPLQISQWTMASARGHPVLLDTVRRVVEMALEDPDAQKKSVMERTGPGPFTDAVLSYLLVQYRKPWGDLRGLGSGGWRFRASEHAPELLRASRYGGAHPERWGDAKVLQITGFSPGVGHMGAQGVDDAAAMAAHAFAGSWRSQKGADL